MKVQLLLFTFCLFLMMLHSYDGDKTFIVFNLLRQTELNEQRFDITIATPFDKYKAYWGPGGRIQAPSIPLKVFINNLTSEEWSCSSGKILLDVTAQQSKRHEIKAFSIANGGLRIAAGEKVQERVEVGEFLTGIAGGYVKGDTLEVKTAMSCQSTEGETQQIRSNMIQISVFVPEG